MEPEVRNYLIKIAVSISVILLWMLINVSIGIGFNYAFFEKSPGLANYMYYILFIFSLVALIFYLKRKWE